MHFLRFPGQGPTSCSTRAEGGGAGSTLLRVSSLAPVAAAALATSVSTRNVANAAETSSPRVANVPGENKKVDVVLSSGFLSFANHAGFLKAVEDSGLEVGGIMGTSAGALSGSLYAAGYSPAQIAHELSKRPPADYLSISQKPWEGGVLCMDKAIARYRELLPATFEELGREFAVGVFTRDGQYLVLDSGPLPEAVVASAAIPYVFENVRVPGVGDCMDGGKYDRVGLDGWRERRVGRGEDPDDKMTLVHLISRSSPFSGAETVSRSDKIIVVRSPKSGVSLNSLGDFEQHYNIAYQRSSLQLAQNVKVC